MGLRGRTPPVRLRRRRSPHRDGEARRRRQVLRRPHPRHHEEVNATLKKKIKKQKQKTRSVVLFDVFLFLAFSIFTSFSSWTKKEKSASSLNILLVGYLPFFFLKLLCYLNFLQKFYYIASQFSSLSFFLCVLERTRRCIV